LIQQVSGQEKVDLLWGYVDFVQAGEAGVQHHFFLGGFKTALSGRQIGINMVEVVF